VSTFPKILGALRSSSDKIGVLLMGLDFEQPPSPIDSITINRSKRDDTFLCAFLNKVIIVLLKNYDIKSNI
jgi:hypothetical protein